MEITFETDKTIFLNELNNKLQNKKGKLPYMYTYIDVKSF